MGIEYCSLLISIIALLVAISAIIIAERRARSQKKESTEKRKFLEYLVVNSAADPDTLRRLLDDYNQTGEWRGELAVENGKGHINWKLYLKN